MYSRLLVAIRGITAGSGFATTELKVMMIDLVNMLQGRWASMLTTKVFVDDLTLAVTGWPKYVMGTFAVVSDFVVEAMEDGMRTQVSAKKSRAIASKPQLGAKYCWATHGGKLSGDRRAKLLGTDTRWVGEGTRLRLSEAEWVDLWPLCPSTKLLKRSGRMQC